MAHLPQYRSTLTMDVASIAIHAISRARWLRKHNSSMIACIYMSARWRQCRCECMLAAMPLQCMLAAMPL